MRIAIGVEYDGTHYSGWQVQSGQPTVQATIERALSHVANHPVKTITAGRTDSGVHALQQVVHFDTDVVRQESGWVLGCNTALPADVNVLWAQPVTDDFSARFSAIKRRYRYLILNRRSRSAVHRDRMWWVFRPLDIAKMQAAANLLLGTHDYSSFRAKACQAHSPVRTIDSITIKQQDDCIAIDIEAPSFLHHMVRNLVGVLVPIGEGKQPVEWASAVLQARDRGQGGLTSPPQGLYFISVEYPAKFSLPTVSAFPVLW